MPPEPKTPARKTPAPKTPAPERPRAKGPGAPGGRPRKPCPICGRPSSAEATPFCSDRCREVDLGRWLSGSYVIPARDNEDEDAE